MSALLIPFSRSPRRGIRLVSCDGPRWASWAVEYLSLAGTGLQVVRRRACLTQGDAKRFFKKLRAVHRVPVLPDHAYKLPAFPDLDVEGRAA